MKIIDHKPQVGIFEIVENVFIKETEDTEEISDSGRFFDGFDPHYHKDAIKLYVSQYDSISEETKEKFRTNPSEYLKYPRGRVDYDTVDKKWSIMSSREVLSDEGLLERITREFNLPSVATGKIVLEADEGHYGIY